MIGTLQTNPSQRAAQELERLKQQINWKVEDIEAGYDLLLADLEPKADEYKRLNGLVTATVARHADILKLVMVPWGRHRLHRTRQQHHPEQEATK